LVSSSSQSDGSARRRCFLRGRCSILITNTPTNSRTRPRALSEVN
jgi:hypothetical protein